MSAMDTTQQTLEEKVCNAQYYENVPVKQAAFNRRHSVDSTAPPGGRRASLADSIKKDFDETNIAMVTPDMTHIEMSDDVSKENSIDDIAVSWYVWLVAATASIAGSLFGYDTGEYSSREPSVGA